jgi:hypothetical protein
MRAHRRGRTSGAVGVNGIPLRKSQRHHPIGTNSFSGSVLVAHVAAPDETTMRIVELRRGETAAPAPPGPGPSSAMPQFRWPPPRWTARAVLPAGTVVTAEGEQLGSVFDRLRLALRRAGIPEWSVYAIGSDGFAVVSRLESIQDDGRPTAERWAVEPVRPRIFSLSDYITALFRATPGRYRTWSLLLRLFLSPRHQNRWMPRRWSDCSEPVLVNYPRSCGEPVCSRLATARRWSTSSSGPAKTTDPLKWHRAAFRFPNISQAPACGR